MTYEAVYIANPPQVDYTAQDRHTLARLIRAEFDRTHKEAHNFEVFEELIGMAERFRLNELAIEMRNDLHTGTL